MTQTLNNRCAAFAAAVAAALTMPNACAARPAPPALQPASGLFTYHRADNPPNGVTTVHLDASHTGAPIQQNVFGNFLEHLGSVVYGGVWADALLNPNLEKIDDADTAPRHWTFGGGASWQDGGYLSPRSVRLAAAGDTLDQRVFLPVQRIRRFRGTLYARAAGTPGQLTVSLQGVGEHAAQAFAGTTIGVPAGDWRKITFEWRLPAAVPVEGEEERFDIAFGAGGPIDVDEVQLFPADAIDGMDPDVIRAARAWHIPILRMGGNFSSGYHWQEGVGPRERRPTGRNPAWGGVESNEFGTDEFLELCRLIGAAPQIAVNAGHGTPEEAAAWVRYCSTRTPHVAVWEIGNELYGGWQIGHTDAPGNAARFVQFRDAMLKVDPHLRIIATGRGDQFLPAGVASDVDWNRQLLQAAAANGGPLPEYLSLHPLVPMPGGLRDLSYAEQYESAMAHPAFVDRTLIPALADGIRQLEGPSGLTLLAPTEWGIIVGGDRWRESPNHDSEAGAIFNALTLNAFLRHSDEVALANMTGLMHGGGIKKPRGVVIVDPQYYTQQLYAMAEPRLPVATTWEGPGHDVPQRSYLPAVPDVPDVDVLGALSADRRRLMVSLVNRQLNDARPVHLDLQGIRPGKVSAVILTAADPGTGNTWDHPENVAPRPFTVTPSPDHNGWTLSLPPHSLVILTIQARGR